MTDGHSSADCTTYSTYSTYQRLSKYRELKLCTQCTSPKHASGPYCPASKSGPGGLFKVCKYCKSDNHVAALCNNRKSTPPTIANVCLSTNVGQKSNFLLPILSIKLQVRSGCVVTRVGYETKKILAPFLKVVYDDENQKKKKKVKNFKWICPLRANLYTVLILGMISWWF